MGQYPIIYHLSKDSKSRMNPFALALSSALAGDVKLNLEGFDVICRKSDGYVNASALCNAFNATRRQGEGKKEYNAWIKRDGPQDFMIDLYCDIHGATREELGNSPTFIEVEPPTIVGGSGNNPHSKLVALARAELEKYCDEGRYTKATWVHPQVAIAVAQWISSRFAVKVTKWIYELFICGSTHLSLTRSSGDILNEQLRQMSLTVQEKDSTISRLELEIANLKREIRESSTVLLKEIKDNHAELSIVHREVDLANTRLVEARSEATEARAILMDVAERIVPAVSNTKTIEVFLLFRTATGYSMRGVQRKNLGTLKKEMGTPAILELDCAPNSILLKSEIRSQLATGSKRKLAARYSDLTVVDKSYTEEMLVSDIRAIYAKKY